MNSKAALVECSHCEGTGKMPLSPELDQTLRAVGRRRPTAAELAAMLSTPAKQIETTAVNMRLLTLKKLGLVERIRDGRNWRYSKHNSRKDAVK